MKTANLLFALILPATVLTGCHKPEFIDFDTTPPEERFDAERDTLDIVVMTVAEESIEVWNGDLAERRGFAIEYLGTFNDPVFGITNASVATHIDLPENNMKFGTSPQADSAVFVIRYGAAFYGNINTPQTFEVYEVNQRLYETDKYYAGSDISTGSALIGTWTGVPNPADTTFRISISNTFADKVISGTSTDYQNQINFKSYINGLYIKPVNPGLAKGEGALITTNLSSSLSRLIVYYSNSDTSGIVDEFPIVETSVRLTLTDRDYTGTEVETQLQNPGQQFEKAFLQPIEGLKAHIQLPGLRDFANNNPELVIIHRARLVIPQYTSNPSDTLSPPGRLFLFRALDDTSNDYRNNIPDKQIASTFGGNYNVQEKQYSFLITRYLQEEYQQMLADPSYESTGLNILIPSNFVERLVIPTHNTTQGNPVRLEVIYSKVD